MGLGEENPFKHSFRLRLFSRDERLNHVLGNMDAGERGIAALLSKVDNFPKSLDDALHYARILDVKK